MAKDFDYNLLIWGAVIVGGLYFLNRTVRGFGASEENVATRQEARTERQKNRQDFWLNFIQGKQEPNTFEYASSENQSGTKRGNIRYVSPLVPEASQTSWSKLAQSGVLSEKGKTLINQGYTSPYVKYDKFGQGFSTAYSGQSSSSSGLKTKSSIFKIARTGISNLFRSKRLKA